MYVVQDFWLSVYIKFQKLNLALFGKAVSEMMMFERCGHWTDAGAMVYCKLTFELSAQVS